MLPTSRKFNSYSFNTLHLLGGSVALQLAATELLMNIRYVHEHFLFIYLKYIYTTFLCIFKN